MLYVFETRPTVGDGEPHGHQMVWQSEVEMHSGNDQHQVSETLLQKVPFTKPHPFQN